MDLNTLFNNPSEKPLENFPSCGGAFGDTDGGFSGIFRTIACVGDSLSSGEFVSKTEDGTPSWHDMYDYSWGQYLARLAGCTVYNFSRGGMTASEYLDSFAEKNDMWNPDKAAQAYLIALGVNDIINIHKELGSTADIDLSDRRNNNRTFAGDMGQIIQRYKEISPNARFFLLTMPHDRGDDEEAIRLGDAHAELMYSMAELFPHTYVMDFRKYAPPFDEKFQELFYLFDHLNPMGYLFFGKMVASYLDFIIRHNMKDFIQAGFIGTPYYMERLDK